MRWWSRGERVLRWGGSLDWDKLECTCPERTRKKKKKSCSHRVSRSSSPEPSSRSMKMIGKSTSCFYRRTESEMPALLTPLAVVQCVTMSEKISWVGKCLQPFTQSWTWIHVGEKPLFFSLICAREIPLFFSLQRGHYFRSERNHFFLEFALERYFCFYWRETFIEFTLEDMSMPKQLENSPCARRGTQELATAVNPLPRRSTHLYVVAMAKGGWFAAQ